MSSPLSMIRRFWKRLSLVRQFLLMSMAVFLAGMWIVGAWVSYRLERDVTQNTAIATALFLESLVTPLLQDLAHSDSLPEERQAALETLMASTSLGKRVLSFKIWRKGGVVVYASSRDLIGKQFSPTPKLMQAWVGSVAASFDDLDHEENQEERARGIPLLEIYVPIREQDGDRVIAVVEFYERAEELKRDILYAKIESWLIIAGVAICALLLLTSIVRRANRLIEQQQKALEGRVSELGVALSQNEVLRERVERASRRATEINERYLRRLGAELHDGPAQLIGLALLRLDAVGRTLPTLSPDDSSKSTEVDTVRTALNEALNEIRTISYGLSLPELESLSMAETIATAVRAHTRRTKTHVDVELDSDLAYNVAAGKAAIFRLVQESLNNAMRHAGGQGQRVRARRENGLLVVEVSDTGPGFDPGQGLHGDRLGLAGMRERIESLGGRFAIISSGGGTLITATLPLHSDDHPAELSPADA